jgi:uncharacterized protein with PIN domain
MGVAWFRFYAELNDFLSPDKKRKKTMRHFDTIGPVKDLIESFGVPHTEVDLVLINGEPVGFSHPVRDGDRVSVYPIFESLDISSVSKVRPVPLQALRFVLDVHLGRLASYLRMAGFDALYRNNASDSELAALAVRERRVLLTRDRYLLMRSEVDHGYWIRSVQPKQQLIEVVKRFDLAGCMHPFTRCMQCNGVLEAVSRDAVLERLPPRVRDKAEFRLCSDCGAVYWEGTHHAQMKKLLEWLTANTNFL